MDKLQLGVSWAGLKLHKQWTGSLCTYTASSLWALRIHREKAIWLIRNFSPQESWKHLHAELLAGRVLTRNSTGLQAKSWLFEHTATSDSPKACCLQKNLLLRAENSSSALAMWTVTRILTAVASGSVPDFLGIASLSTFFLLLNPFYHHRLKVLGNLFSSSLPIFRVRMTWLSFSFPYFDSVLLSCLLPHKKLHC